jgi:hypothetical protein
MPAAVTLEGTDWRAAHPTIDKVKTIVKPENRARPTAPAVMYQAQQTNLKIS